MEISRLSFTKETKEKMSKELNKFQRGKLRWAKLREAEANGKLDFAKNRYEVANLCGYTEAERSQGHGWVTRKILNHQLQETLHGVGKDGRMEYEYHILADPDYEFKGVKEQRQREKELGTRLNKPLEPVVQISRVPSNNPTVYRVEIVRGDTTIKVELANYDEVSEFVKTILKGE